MTLASRHAARLTEGAVPLIPAWAWDDTEILVPNAPEVLTEQTRARLGELDFRWIELQTLWDVDRPADYERLVTSGILPASKYQEP